MNTQKSIHLTYVKLFVKHLSVHTKINKSKATPPRFLHAGGVASVYSSEILNVFPKLSAILWRNAREGL